MMPGEQGVTSRHVYVSYVMCISMTVSMSSLTIMSLALSD